MIPYWISREALAPAIAPTTTHIIAARQSATTTMARTTTVRANV